MTRSRTVPHAPRRAARALRPPRLRRSPQSRSPNLRTSHQYRFDEPPPNRACANRVNFSTGDGRPKRIGVAPEVCPTFRMVGFTEIPSKAKPLVVVSRQGGVPAVQIGALLRTVTVGPRAQHRASPTARHTHTAIAAVSKLHQAHCRKLPVPQIYSPCPSTTPAPSAA